MKTDYIIKRDIFKSGKYCESTDTVINDITKENLIKNLIDIDYIPSEIDNSVLIRKDEETLVVAVIHKI